jgi:hypothetical protein
MSTSTLLASGTFRDVFIYDEHRVRKVNRETVPPCVRRPFDPNRREYRRWLRVSKTNDARYFAAIQKLPDGQILQERALKTLGDVRGVFFPISDELQEVADRWGILDTTAANVGIFADGSQKFIDYADGCCPKECYWSNPRRTLLRRR